MSNSTTLVDQISVNQSNKEVVANANFDAASPGMLWGRHASTCNLLVWGYYGGMYSTPAASTPVANGTITLVASTTNYVFANATTGAVSVNQTGFAPGVIPLYTIITGATTVTSYTDQRSFQPGAVLPGTGSNPYDMMMFFPGLQVSANQIMSRVTVPRVVTFPVSLTGSYASAAVAFTAAAVFSITRNGTTIGTVSFAASASVGTFSFTSAVTTTAGDIIDIIGPATVDATGAGVSITLVGAR